MSIQTCEEFLDLSVIESNSAFRPEVFIQELFGKRVGFLIRTIGSSTKTFKLIQRTLIGSRRNPLSLDDISGFNKPADKIQKLQNETTLEIFIFQLL